MQPTTGVDENELQKAINSITSAAPGVEGAAPVDPVKAVSDKVAAAEKAEEAKVEEVAPAVTETPAEAEVAPVAADAYGAENKAAYGDPDLGAVKTKALSDLRPLIEQVDLSPESKFKIYRELITSTNDKASIEPAYTAAAGIAVDKDRAEALLFIVETIDKLGIGAS